MSSLVLFVVVLAVVFCLFGLDDLWVDLQFLRRRQPRVARPPVASGKRVAILVPAWKENGVIGRMLQGNLARIDYDDYAFFVGVYPNDPATVREVQALEKTGRVFAVVNPSPGPTSKGQMLNVLVRAAVDHGTKQPRPFDAILLHDAEDIVHPASLRLVAEELAHADFVQIPVFSLPLPWRELVGGTYVDEFAESHLKDMVVRSEVGAAVPSAGVGTAISRRALTALLPQRNGRLFAEDALTEDYELGHSVHAAGFPATFALRWVEGEHGLEPIATREFFPKTFVASMRQRSRWTLGIAVFGWRRVPWTGSAWNRYFLWRDRKGPLANTVVCTGYGLLLAWPLLPSELRGVGSPPELDVLLGGTLGLMTLRLGIRGWAVSRLYAPALLPVLPLRAALGNFINVAATARALGQATHAFFTGRRVAWQKTTHELPADFGIAEVAS